MKIGFFLGKKKQLDILISVAIPQTKILVKRIAKKGVFVYHIKYVEGIHAGTIGGKVYGWAIKSITQLVNYYRRWYRLKDGYSFAHFFALQKYMQSPYGGTNPYKDVRGGGITAAFLFLPDQYIVYTGHPFKKFTGDLNSIKSDNLISVLRSIDGPIIEEPLTVHVKHAYPHTREELQQLKRRKYSKFKEE